MYGLPTKSGNNKKEINAMKITTIEHDQADEDVLYEQISDETVERAAGNMGRMAMTIAMCSGLSSCPSAPA